MSERQCLTAYLVVDNAAAAIDFYKSAFGAEELSRHHAPQSERIMHAHLKLLGSELMLSDDFSEKMGQPRMTPTVLGGSPVTLSLVVDDANTIWDKAVKAGAVVTMPLKEQFWGDLFGQFTDPFGHKWSVSQTVKQVDPATFAEEAEKAFNAS